MSLWSILSFRSAPPGTGVLSTISKGSTTSWSLCLATDDAQGAAMKIANITLMKISRQILEGIPTFFKWLYLCMLIIDLNLSTRVDLEKAY